MDVKSEAMQALVRHYATAGLISLNLIGSGCTSAAEPTVARCVVPIGTAPTRGPSDAWVTIVEFGDFQCYYCGQAESVVREVDAARPGVRWAWKHMPLTQIHAHALEAALAAECAKEQGQFWEMHDVLFAHQTALAEASLLSYAEELGLDLTLWNDCRASDAARQRIVEDYKLGVDVGVGGTPTFFVNGAALPGAYPTENFLELIDAAETTAKQSGIAATDYYGSIEKQGCSGL